MYNLDDINRLIRKYGCDSETACRYLDLREEGYPMHQALLMAGLTDPPDPGEE
jgi:hypothetical protein